MYIIESGEYSDIISWSKDGTAFVVKDSDAFTIRVLQVLLEMSKFESFTRKLSRWGFAKRAARDRSKLLTQMGTMQYAPPNTSTWFCHPSFRKGNFESCKFDVICNSKVDAEACTCILEITLSQEEDLMFENAHALMRSDRICARPPSSNIRAGQDYDFPGKGVVSAPLYLANHPQIMSPDASIGGNTTNAQFLNTTLTLPASVSRSSVFSPPTNHKTSDIDPQGGAATLAADSLVSLLGQSNDTMATRNYRHPHTNTSTRQESTFAAHRPSTARAIWEIRREESVLHQLENGCDASSTNALLSHHQQDYQHLINNPELSGGISSDFYKILALRTTNPVLLELQLQYQQLYQQQILYNQQQQQQQQQQHDEQQRHHQLIAALSAATGIRDMNLLSLMISHDDQQQQQEQQQHQYHWPQRQHQQDDDLNNRSLEVQPGFSWWQQEYDAARRSRYDLDNAGLMQNAASLSDLPGSERHDMQFQDESPFNP